MSNYGVLKCIITNNIAVASLNLGVHVHIVDISGQKIPKGRT